MSRRVSQARLRTATLSDIDTLLAFMEHFYKEEQIPFVEERATRALRQLLDAPDWGRIHLIEADAETVGYIVVIFSFILEFGGRQAFIDEFYIRPECRGCGHGTKILQDVEALCRAGGIGVMRLEVARSNAVALALYARFGFQQHDRYTMTRELH